MGLWQTRVSEVLIHDVEVQCVGCAIVIKIEDARLTCELLNAATIPLIHALVQIPVAGTAGLGGEELIELRLELLVVRQLLRAQIYGVAGHEQISLIESDGILRRRLEIVELEFTLKGKVAGLAVALHKLVAIVPERLGDPGARRAVGRANGMNMMSIIIPCHRVIRADGTLCGYGGGLWRKKWLFEHERKFVRAQEDSNLRPSD